MFYRQNNVNDGKVAPLPKNFSSFEKKMNRIE